jgi:hypothetical protein
MYQQTRISDLTPIGAPGPIPYAVANWSDAELANLDAMNLDPSFGLAGMGIWPVIVAAPVYDPSTQILVQPDHCDSADAKTKRWTATATVRPMTADELAAANPVPDSVTNYQARQALIDAGLFAQVDKAIKGADQTVKSNLEAFQAWEYANNFYREQPFIVALGPSFDLKPADIDNLFREAAKVS